MKCLWGRSETGTVQCTAFNFWRSAELGTEVTVVLLKIWVYWKGSWQVDCGSIFPRVNHNLLKETGLIRKVGNRRNFHGSPAPLLVPGHTTGTLLIHVTLWYAPPQQLGNVFRWRCTRNMGVEQAKAWCTTERGMCQSNEDEGKKKGVGVQTKEIVCLRWGLERLCRVLHDDSLQTWLFKSLL